MDETVTFADAGPDHSAGVMLCVRPDNPERFVIDGGTPVEEVHLTLLYFGKTDTFDGPAAEQAKEVITSEIAPTFKPIHGEITAVTTFELAGEDQPPLVLLVDAPGLNELQAKALGSLRSALGSDQQPYSNHGFIPHITLSYGAEEAEWEFARSLVGEPVHFENIELVWGTESSVWALGESLEGASIADQEGEHALQLGGELSGPRTDIYTPYAEEANGMPYIIVEDHPECGGDKPVAVTKKATGEVMGCHANKDDAAKQIAALMANEVASVDDHEERLANLDGFLAANGAREFAPVAPAAPVAALDHSTFSAVPVHHTATTDSKDFDGDVIKTRTRRGLTSAYYNAIYAWHDSTGKPTNKTTYRFPHHQVSESGDPGAAVGWACHAALMLIDDSGIPKDDYRGVYNHLAAHLKDAGLDVPKLGEDNLSVNNVRANTVEEDSMEAPFDVTKVNDAALVGEFMRRYLESLSGAKDEQHSDQEADEFAPKKGVNPFPPKKKNDPNAPDDDPEDKKEAPEVPGEAPDPEDKKEAPEGDAKPSPEKGVNPFPPKTDKPTDDGDPEDKKEVPETPDEKSDPEDKAEVPEKPVPVAPDTPVPSAPIIAPEDPTKKKKMIGQGNGTYEWEGVLVVEGIPSGDGRMIDQNALTWRELPLPLMLQTVNAEGHSGAVICGSIHEVERVGQDIIGRGNFDSGPAGQEAKRLLTEGTMRGVSADIDSVKVDLRDSGGNSLNMEDVLFGEAQAMEVLVQGRVMGATLTPFPAFQEAHIEVLDNATEDPSLVAAGATFEGEVWRFSSPYPICMFGVHEPVEIASLVASGTDEGFPVNPPLEWFALRDMDEPQPFTVHPDGRVYGLVAQFGTCHIGFRNKCVEIPKSMSNYRYFRNKQVLTAEGSPVQTGPIFMDTVHPNLRLRASDAEAHYAHTGCAIADVALYENEHGIVAAGALRPDATPEQVRSLRGSDISPDWRSISGRLELVGLLGVNVSGFIVPALAASGAPVIQMETLTPRAQVNVVTDEVEALVAAGSLGCSTCGNEGFSIGSDAVSQIIEMLSSHEAKLAELSEAVRPIRADRVFARMANLVMDSASKKE